MIAQGQDASNFLRESLRIVLDDNYAPPSPLREVATNRSIDELAPKDPHAAEMAQIREALDEIRKKVTPRLSVPQSVRDDIEILRLVLLANAGSLGQDDIDLLSGSSAEQRRWVVDLREEWESKQPPKKKDNSDPWASDAPGGYSDEPPF